MNLYQEEGQGAHIYEVIKELVLQVRSRNNAGMHYQHSMAGDAQAEGHLPEVLCILLAKVFQVLVLGLHQASHRILLSSRSQFYGEGHCSVFGHHNSCP